MNNEKYAIVRLFGGADLMTDISITGDYVHFLNDIKRDIQSSRIRAHLAVNKELILLYWRIGHSIIQKQKELGWGSKVVEQLSQDLRHAFPGMKGLSKQNLWYMRQFATAYSQDEIVQQLVGELPWGHHIEIFSHVKDIPTCFWYIRKTIENGWSRNVLVMNIEAQAHLKLGAASTNFVATLPQPTSDLAHQLIKSEYNFEFLGLADDVHERMIEKGLVENIRQFLLELGNGFAFMGTQYKLNVGDEDFYIDLLFYHTRLRCYVVFELKADKFRPEYAGKLGFYMTAINRQIKHEADNPTIGILLCKQANKVVVEYSLSHNNQPMGVASYTTGLPSEYSRLLPTPEQFQHLVDTLEVE